MSVLGPTISAGVDDRIAAAVGVDLDLRTGWLHSLGTVNVTAVPVSRQIDGYAATPLSVGTLVSPKHFITAWHVVADLDVTTLQITCNDAGGTPHSVYCAAKRRFIQDPGQGDGAINDIGLVTLASEMPAGVTPAKVAATDPSAYLQGDTGFPMVVVDRDQNVQVMETDTLDDIVVVDAPTTEPRSDFYTIGAPPGSSGNAIAFVIGGALVLASVVSGSSTGTTNGPGIWNVVGAINTAMAEDGAYALDVEDLSGYSLALTAGTADAAATYTSVALSISGTAGGTEPYTYQWHASTSSGFTPSGATAIAGATSTTHTLERSPGTWHFACVVSSADAQTATARDSAQTSLDPSEGTYMPGTWSSASSATAGGNGGDLLLNVSGTVYGFKGDTKDLISATPGAWSWAGTDTFRRSAGNNISVKGLASLDADTWLVAGYDAGGTWRVYKCAKTAVSGFLNAENGGQAYASLNIGANGGDYVVQGLVTYGSGFAVLLFHTGNAQSEFRIYNSVFADNNNGANIAADTTNAITLPDAPYGLAAYGSGFVSGDYNVAGKLLFINAELSAVTSTATVTGAAEDDWYVGLAIDSTDANTLYAINYTDEVLTLVYTPPAGGALGIGEAATLSTGTFLTRKLRN